MTNGNEPQKYISRTQGVCPPEIHFQIEGEVLREVRFMGGGCPGNAQLVSRLLHHMPLKALPGLLGGISCKNKTSCPDQLFQALKKVEEGELLPARSFQIVADPQKRKRIALVGALDGRVGSLRALASRLKEEKIEMAYCLGNITGGSLADKALLQGLRKEKHFLAIQGDKDWALARQIISSASSVPLEPKEKDYFDSLGQVFTFQLGGSLGMGFYGRYLQDLPGYSDYEPFALEMNLISNLTQFMQDETVFPALLAMIPQFKAQVIAFSQVRKWGYWQVGGLEVISLGPALEEGKISCGILEERGGQLRFQIKEWPFTLEDESEP
jgi:uncharacterized protein (TIGR03905 family)